MRFFKCSLLAFCFFVAGVNSLRAQNLIFTLDSIRHGNVISHDTAYIVDSGIADEVSVYVHLYNNDSNTVFLNNLSLWVSINDSTLSILDTNNLKFTPPYDTLKPGNSVLLTLQLLTSPSDPLPNLLPTGSSVVIWPVYSINPVPPLSTDSAFFWLIGVSSDTVAGVTNLQNIYNTILYNAQTIYVTFSNTDEKTIQLYDATGRKVYDSESNSANADIDWSTLPAAIYILRIRHGQQSVSVKLVHF